MLSSAQEPLELRRGFRAIATAHSDHLLDSPACDAVGSILEQASCWAAG